MKCRIEVRSVIVKYSGSLQDYTIQELEDMAWATMDRRGDYTPDDIQDWYEDFEDHTWIAADYKSQHLAEVCIAQAVEMEDF